MTNERIHPTALIDSKAELADDVSVGAYSIIGANVRIDSGSQIDSHCVIKGPTEIGKNNRIYPFNSIGEAPQDKKYADEDTRLVIGDGNTIREYCTLNRGTVQDQGVTSIGNDNWIMAYVHVAHDCIVGNHTILANSVQLAGHVTVGDYVIMGGFSGCHQFCHIGAHAFCANDSKITQDILPFTMISGSPAKPRGLNSEGLKRRGFSEERIRAIKQAYRILFRSKLKLNEAKVELEALATDHTDVADMLAFVNASERGLARNV